MLTPTMPFRPGCEARLRRRVAAVVEAEPVDHRAMPREAEHARRGVAGLRPGRCGPDLGEAATEPQHGIHDARVFVEPGRDADRVGKGLAPERDLERPLAGAPFVRVDAELERPQRERVGGLGFEREQQRLREARQHAQHGASGMRPTSSGMTGTPSPSRGSGLVQSACAVVRGP